MWMYRLTSWYGSLSVLKRRSWIFLFFVMFLSMYVFFVFSSQRKEQKVLEQKILLSKSILKQRENDVESSHFLKNKLSSLKSSIEQQKINIPDDTNIPEFVKEVSLKASALGVSIKQFEPMFEKEKEYFSEISFSIHVYGSYHQTALFIDEILHMGRVVTVENTVLEMPRKEGPKIVLNSSFIVKTYRFLAEKIKKDQK
jgi:type IV pilus assembly protein PilO